MFFVRYSLRVFSMAISSSALDLSSSSGKAVFPSASDCMILAFSSMKKADMALTTFVTFSGDSPLNVILTDPVPIGEVVTSNLMFSRILAIFSSGNIFSYSGPEQSPVSCIIFSRQVRLPACCSRKPILCSTIASERDSTCLPEPLSAAPARIRVSVM